MFKKDSFIYIAGHTGLLGSAILSQLRNEGYINLITKTHDELDLTKKDEVETFFMETKIEYIFLCAAKVGGILGNKTYPASYLHENLAIQDNIFELSIKYNIKNIIFYGSSCTYPKVCPQPMKEEYWMSGKIEETSMGYATAKIAGILASKVYNIQYNTNKFICLIPNSMYGKNDNFDLENSHVFSALIRRFHEAKENSDKDVTLWGSGKPRREFIFNEDVADASIFLMKNVHKLENRFYNLGVGIDYSIEELAQIIAEIVDFKGKVYWDTSKPDGVFRKLLDSSDFLSLGWEPKTDLKRGVKITYDWYKDKKCK
ncbi:GDP-L-fucose synthase family protein [Malaciobacter marinus]|uniref:GDP-L-fucose synthase family protein n=1 Tax=Malaciobacter marinus TaxID=505249 RepID=UPI003B008D07